MLLAAGACAALIWTARERERETLLPSTSSNQSCCCMTAPSAGHEGERGECEGRPIYFLAVHRGRAAAALHAEQSMHVSLHCYPCCHRPRSARVELSHTGAPRRSLSEPRPYGHPHFINATSTVGGRALKSCCLVCPCRPKKSHCFVILTLAVRGLSLRSSASATRHRS